MYYVLWYSGKPENIKALIGSICQLPWCKYSHPGQFQAYNVLITTYKISETFKIVSCAGVISSDRTKCYGET